MTSSPLLDLTSEQLHEFVATGVLVIDDVLTPAEVDAARADLHDQLRTHGVDHERLLNGEQSGDGVGVRLKSPAAHFFFARHKLLNVHLHPRVVHLARQLLLATFGGTDPAVAAVRDDADAPLFAHPFGAFDAIGALADRVCYRLPDCVRAEGGLDVHIDRNAVDPFANLTRWRPIQAFVALTDQYGGESGGLRCTRGFHRRYGTYDVGRGGDNGGDKGEFNRLNPKRHGAIVDACLPVDCSAGSIVFWDNRLPHATAQKLTSRDTREVVYVGLVPLVPLNVQCIQDQAVAIRQNIEPPLYCDQVVAADRDWELDELTDEQRDLLGLNARQRR
jgi:hypothetical protein